MSDEWTDGNDPFFGNENVDALHAWTLIEQEEAMSDDRCSCMEPSPASVRVPAGEDFNTSPNAVEVCHCGGVIRRVEAVCKAELTHDEKLKSLAKWRWEAKLLAEDLATTTDFHRLESVANHLRIVDALVCSAEKELGLNGVKSPKLLSDAEVFEFMEGC